MFRRFLASSASLALLCLMLWPGTASAQSAISGLVTDGSGAVLPGVTVEATSPALIEKSRTMVSDSSGRYSIVDLRPGTYTVTFTLEGFAAFRRSDIELPSNFVATINAQLKLGTLAETVTVTGQSPVVDVQSSQRVTVLSRAFIDSLPTTRTYASDATLSLGVVPNGQNVGGGRASTQQRLLVHGAAAVENTISVDGMKMNTNVGDGVTISQHNEAMTQEVTTQTSSPGADVSGAGLLLNLIPREGGNDITGSNFASFTDGSLQSSNLTPELREKGLTTVDAIDYAYDINPTIGGPLMRDHVWFFGAYRLGGNANIVPNTFFDDGSPAVNNQTVQNATVRLTAQLTPRNKVTAYLDRAFKTVPYNLSPGDDPETAARQQPGILYYTSQIKWTSPVTNRLMFEGGLALVNNAYGFTYQPGIDKVRGTPEWYATASRQDLVLQTKTVAFERESRFYPPLAMLSGSTTYVTGSHTLKGGVQWRFGPFRTDIDGNADLVQRYRTGVPDSVTVSNTPVVSSTGLNSDLGAYVQDSWTLKRLTLNPGVRFEYLNAQVKAQAVPAGRFVGARSFPEMANLPDWFDIAPRFGLAYDLTGDAKTALKAGVNKYHSQYTTGFADRYNPLSLSTDTRNWSDCDFVPGTSRCSGLALPTNGDNIAQDNEIGPSNNRLFGAAPTRRPDPDIRRDYTVEYSVGIDRELFPGVSLGGSWYRRTWHNLPIQVNTLVSHADYAAFTTPNPLTGEPIIIFNLDPAKQGLVDLVDYTSTDSSTTSRNFTGFDMQFQARLPNGAQVIGGWSANRLINVDCNVADPNRLRLCDWSQFDIPFRNDFKIVGSHPLGYGLQVGAVVQSYGGVAPGCRGSTTGVCQSQVAWVVPQNLFPGGQRTQSVTVNLIEPGTNYLPRWTQVDLSVRRAFRVGKMRLDGSLDLFNLFNVSTVLNQNVNYGTSLNQPTEILQGRLLRFSTGLTF